MSDPSDPIVRLSAALPLGRLYERPGEAGASALIAELLERRGPAHSTLPLSLRVESLGTQLEVEQEPDLTCLSIETLAEDWREGLALLVDVLRRSDFDETAIWNYRIGPGYSIPTTTSELDMTGSRFRPRVELERILGGYPLAPPNPGGQVTSTAVEALASRSLRANRVVLAIGGNVPPNEVEVALNDLTLGWESSTEPLELMTVDGKSAKPAYLQTIDEPSAEGWIAMGRVLGPLPNSEQPALALLAEILGVRLTIAVREMRGLANNVSLQIPRTTSRAGLFVIRTGGRAEGIAPTVKFVLEELARIQGSSDAITEEELELSKGILVLGQWQTALDGARQVTTTYAAETVRHGDVNRLLGWPAAVEAVTSREVKALAEKYLAPEEITIVLVGPIDKIREARHPRWPLSLEDVASSGPPELRLKASGRDAQSLSHLSRTQVAPRGATSFRRAAYSMARQQPRAQSPLHSSPSRSAPEVQELFLENGLRLLVVGDHRTPRVAASLWYRVGGLQEAAGEHGSTHFLEHAIFQGTTSVGTRDFKAERPILERIHQTEQELLMLFRRDRNRLRERAVFFDELDWPITSDIERLRQRLYELEDQDSQYREFWAEYNWYRRYGGLTWHTDPVPASTGSENVEIDIDLPKESVELFFRIEADRMANAVLRGWEAQRFTVLEQSLRTLNRPEARFSQALNGVTGQAHPAYATGSHLRDYAYFNRARMLRIYDEYFVPNNATLILVGDVTLAQARSLAARYFGRIPRAREPPARMDEESEPVWAGAVRLDWLEPLEPRVIVRYRIPGIGHPDRPVFDAIAALLRGRHGLLASRMSATLVFESPANVRFEVAASRSGYPGTIDITALARRDEDLLSIEEVILRTVEDLREGKVDPDVLERARKALRVEWEKTRSTRRGRGLGYELGRFEVMHSWKTLVPYMEERQRVSAGEIQTVARRYFVSGNQVIATTRRSPSGPMHPPQRLWDPK